MFIFFKPILQIMSFLIVGWVSSGLVEKTLNEEKISLELKKAYVDLKEASKHIKALSEMKTEFLKVVNHQLRTPVSIIKGMLSMMAEGSVKGKKLKEFIKKSYLSSERLSTLLDDILLAQTLVGGTFHLNLSPCQIEDIIYTLLEYFKPLARANKLRITFTKPKEPLPTTLADSEMLKRAISRLIDNAILYSDKGRIEISLSLKKQKDKQLIQFTIKDSGIGLDKEDKENLFKLFYRGEKATSLHPNGSGLGLFIVKHIIKAHKGTIRVKSKGRGKGTTFFIALPVIGEM